VFVQIIATPSEYVYKYELGDIRCETAFESASRIDILAIILKKE
jgi:hypothetical protein